MLYYLFICFENMPFFSIIIYVFIFVHIMPAEYLSKSDHRFLKGDFWSRLSFAICSSTSSPKSPKAETFMCGLKIYDKADIQQAALPSKVTSIDDKKENCWEKSQFASQLCILLILMGLALTQWCLHTHRAKEKLFSSSNWDKKRRWLLECTEIGSR